jgi:hypothetical protein
MKISITVKDILEEWLQANGYNGLYQDDGCACTLDDFMPCEEPSKDCIAGKITIDNDGMFKTEA